MDKGEEDNIQNLFMKKDENNPSEMINEKNDNLNDLLVQNYENKNPYYMTDANNFYHPKINNRFNYLNNLSKMNFLLLKL